jgi:hypothetical protein
VVDDPRDEGCLCQGCGRRYRVDVMLADELWKRVCYPDWPNLLCGICIMERIEQLREFDYYDLVHGSLSERVEGER